MQKHKKQNTAMEMFAFCVITFEPVEVKLVSTSKNDMAENWLERL